MEGAEAAVAAHAQTTMAGSTPERFEILLAAAEDIVTELTGDRHSLLRQSYLDSCLGLGKNCSPVA